MRKSIALAWFSVFSVPAFAPIDLPPPPAAAFTCVAQYQMLAPGGHQPLNFRVLLSHQILPPDRPRFPSNREVWENHRELIYETIMGESLLGRELDRIDVSNGKDIELIFHDNPEIVKDAERPKEPQYMAEQRAKFNQWLSNLPPVSNGFTASSPETAGKPEGKILSAKTIHTVPNGAYSFVKIRGERFMRLAANNQKGQHDLIGALEDVDSAGEIYIEQTPSGLSISINLKSGLYTPRLTQALAPAVQALWDQGIYPQNLKLYHHARPIETLHGRTQILLGDLSVVTPTPVPSISPAALPASPFSP